MRALVVCVVISICLLALVPAFAYENDDDDDFQVVASRLDNKLKSLETYNAEGEDGDEDNDNNAEDQDDNVAQDEEIDNTASAETSSAKVIRDVAALEEKIQSSSLSFSARAAVHENLQAIKKDAQLFSQKTGARRQALAEAMTDRMQALRLQLEEADGEQDNEVDSVSSFQSDSHVQRAREDISNIRSSLAKAHLPSSLRSRANTMLEDISSKLEDGASPSQMLAEARQLHHMISDNSNSHQFEETSSKHNRQFEEEEAKVHKINSDISILEESLTSSELPSHVLTMAKDNLAAIQRDSAKFARAEQAADRSRLAEAIKLRMKALKLMLQQDSAPAHSFEAQTNNKRETRVLKDVQQLEETISMTHMTAHKKHEVMSNLEAIKNDAEKLSHATASRAEHLKGAMELRMKALKMQLNNL